jgi:PadR family transcriptional regulator PadR
MPPRMTAATQRVLLSMLNEPRTEHYGLELASAAGLKSGTLYPILSRLEAAGWIVGSWERIDPRAEGRRPRRYYRLTHSGLITAEGVREELRRIVAASTTSAIANPRGMS